MNKELIKFGGRELVVLVAVIAVVGGFGVVLLELPKEAPSQKLVEGSEQQAPTPTASIIAESSPQISPSAAENNLEQWETLSSDKGGFTIKYPTKGKGAEEDWIHEIYETGGVSIGPVIKDTSGNPHVDAARYMVIAIEDQGSSSLNDWVEKIKKEETTLVVQDAVIGGMSGKIFIRGEVLSRAVLVKDSKVYTMSFACGFCTKTGTVQIDKIYRTIVSSFAFTQ